MKHLAIFGLILTFLLMGSGFAQITPELDQKIAQADNSKFLPVIVAFQETFDVANIVAAYELRGNEGLVRTQSIDILKDKAERNHHWLKDYAMQRTSQVRNFQSFWISDMVALEATPAAIREIAQHPEVNMIFLDEEQQFLDYKQGVPMRSAWGLKKIKSDVVNQTYKGRGVLVAVIDTGVNYNHNELQGRVIKGKDCYNHDMDPLDDNGHGSHCSGTIAGTTFGVAPEAKILAVKVLSGGGSGSWQNVADGVQYVADYNDNGKTVDVASMSLGGRAPIRPVLRNAFDNAIQLGIRFAIAAGNAGPSSKTIGTPGDQKDVASIGATDINDRIASFSSRGPVVAYGTPYIKPDVSAPGVNITSCWKGSATATNTISGTSMATPHVAGLMALILEAKPGMKYENVKRILETTSLHLGAKGQNNVYGFGRVQADKAVELVEKLSGRLEIDKEIEFPIQPDGSVELNITKENPLWEMTVEISVTVLTPDGVYDGTFSLIKNGKSAQNGEIKALPANQIQHLGKYTIYDGKNTLVLKAKYTGTSKAPKGKIRIKAKTGW